MEVTRTEARIATVLKDAKDTVEWVKEKGPKETFAAYMTAFTEAMQFTLLHEGEAQLMMDAFNRIRPQEVREEEDASVRLLYDLWGKDDVLDLPTDIDEGKYMAAVVKRYRRD